MSTCIPGTLPNVKFMPFPETAIIIYCLLHIFWRLLNLLTFQRLPPPALPRSRSLWWWWWWWWWWWFWCKIHVMWSSNSSKDFPWRQNTAVHHGNPTYSKSQRRKAVLGDNDGSLLLTKAWFIVLMALEGVALIPCAQPFFLHVPHRWLRVNPQKHSCVQSTCSQPSHFRKICGHKKLWKLHQKNYRRLIAIYCRLIAVFRRFKNCFF